MSHQVEINPEVVRLAQYRTRIMGATVADELARSVVQELIYGGMVDPNCELLVDEESAYANDDALVAAFGVNDLVINGHRFDVRALDAQGNVTLSRALINSDYLPLGTFVVQIDNNNGSGVLVDFLPAQKWQDADKVAGAQSEELSLPVKAVSDFDLLKTVMPFLGAAPAVKPEVNPVPPAFELDKFIANRDQVNSKRQKEIVQGILSAPVSWQLVHLAVSRWSRRTMNKILTDSAVWNRRVERLADKLEPKFKRVDRAQIKTVVSKVGEKFGGQPESGEFRQALLSTLTKEELGRTIGGAALVKATDVAQAVLSGRALTDAVRDLAKNPLAVDIALEIKKQRQQAASFMEASAQELAGAFQQMALQPVYQTHSQDAQSGVENINEALKLLAAGELAQSLNDMENEFSDI